MRPLREDERRISTARSNVTRLTCGEKARRHRGAHGTEHLLHRVERRKPSVDSSRGSEESACVWQGDIASGTPTIMTTWQAMT